MLPRATADPERCIYYRDGGLEARAFDPDSGNSSAIRNRSSAVSTTTPRESPPTFEVSADGRVIVVRPAGAGDTQLTWFERNGEQTGTLGGPGDFSQPRISAQGDRVAFTRPDAQNGNRDVWTIEVARGIAARLTLDPANDWFAVWSPDGKQMAFSRTAAASAGSPHFKSSIDSGGRGIALVGRAGGISDWSRDGRWIALTGSQCRNRGGIGGPRAAVSVSRRRHSGVGARDFHPTASGSAYTSNETGGASRCSSGPLPERRRPLRASIQISDSGGDYPGLAVRRPGALLHVRKTSTSTPWRRRDLHANGTVPRPQPLFRACPGTVPFKRPMRGTPWGHPFDTLDGKRFLVNCQAIPQVSLSC